MRAPAVNRSQTRARRSPSPWRCSPGPSSADVHVAGAGAAFEVPAGGAAQAVGADAAGGVLGDHVGAVDDRGGAAADAVDEVAVGGGGAAGHALGGEVEGGGDGHVVAGVHAVGREVAVAAVVGGADAAEEGAEGDQDAEDGAADRAVFVAAGGDAAADQAAAGQHGGAGGAGPAGFGEAVGVGAGEQGGAVGDGVAEAGVDGAADALLGFGDQVDGEGRGAGEGEDLVGGGVGGAVVDDQQGEVAVVLGGEGVQGAVDPGGFLVGGDDHPQFGRRGRGHDFSQTIVIRLTPPPRPTIRTRSPLSNSSMVRSSWTPMVAEARLPSSGTVTTSFSAGTPVSSTKRSR